MIRKFAFLAAIVAAASVVAVRGQDGSNIRYLKPHEVTVAEIGKRLHIDFFRGSFAMFGSSRNIDTVRLEIDGIPFEFREHRVDDGFNNWFAEQYLESVNEEKGRKLRIVEFELLTFSKDEFKVRAYLARYGKGGTVVAGTSFEKEFAFAKKDIFELLVGASDN